MTKRSLLEGLERQLGKLALIFGKAQNKFREATLRRVIGGLIDAKDWSAIGASVKGDVKLGLTSAVVCGAAVLSIYSYGPQSDAPQPEAT